MSRLPIATRAASASDRGLPALPVAAREAAGGAHAQRPRVVLLRVLRLHLVNDVPGSVVRIADVAPLQVCPRCHATRLVRVATPSLGEFFCAHCDHVWTSEKLSPRVLVVDDDEGVRALASQVLREAGYDVATAADGFDAQQVFNRGRPFDLCVLDMMMPG